MQIQKNDSDLTVSAIYKRHFLQLEKILGLLLCAAFVIWSEKFGGLPKIDDLLKDNRAAIYTALSAVFGALLGFVITSVSILLPACQMPALDMVVKSRHYDQLWETYTSAMWWTALATVSSLGALLIDKDSSGICAHRLVYLVFASTLLSTFRLSRCIWILEQVVRVAVGKKT